MGNYQKVSYDRVCEYCGKQFVAHRANKRFCSKKCKDISLRVRKGISCNPSTQPFDRTCEVCGNPFKTFREAQITCSTECAKKRHRQLYKKAKSEKLCDVCGALFIPRSSIQKTCGDPLCQRIHKKEYNKAHQKQKAINIVLSECEFCGNVFFAEETSGLLRLYKRDGGKCYICGCNCSFDDWQTAKSGNKYPGASYPTIDHVVPVSKGGLDAWDNVRLACWKCNLEKSDTLTDAEGLEADFAYSQKWKPNNKQTAQYTLDGQLVKVWDSTAQIRRELGLNDKYIQNACRRSKTRTGNAYGFHWEYVNEQNVRCG